MFIIMGFCLIILQMFKVINTLLFIVMFTENVVLCLVILYELTFSVSDMFLI